MTRSRIISGNRTAEDVIREYERKLAENKNKVVAPKPKQIAPIKPATNISNPESYIVLPGRTYGNHSYPDLLVSKEKSYFNKNWDEAQAALSKDGFQMPTIRQFVDFLHLLKFGKDVYDGLGNKVLKSEASQIYGDITKARDPWRAEWLDAYFEKQSNVLYLLTENKTKAEKLEACLMEDKAPGIDLGFWLKNATSQGLPTNKTPKGKLYYRAPGDGTVAGFIAYSSRALLNCRYPQGSYSVLGVRKIVPVMVKK